MEPEEFRREFIKTFNMWARSLPKLAKEQLELIKNYTEVFIDEEDE